MFYISYKNKKFRVLDTDDAICEYYTKKDLLEIKIFKELI